MLRSLRFQHCNMGYRTNYIKRSKHKSISLSFPTVKISTSFREALSFCHSFILKCFRFPVTGFRVRLRKFIPIIFNPLNILVYFLAQYIIIGSFIIEHFVCKIPFQIKNPDVQLFHRTLIGHKRDIYKISLVSSSAISLNYHAVTDFDERRTWPPSSNLKFRKR